MNNTWVLGPFPTLIPHSSLSSKQRDVCPEIFTSHALPSKCPKKTVSREYLLKFFLQELKLFGFWFIRSTLTLLTASIVEWANGICWKGHNSLKSKPGLGIRSFAHFAQIKWVTVLYVLYTFFYLKNEWFAHSRFFGKRCERIAQVAHQNELAYTLYINMHLLFPTVATLPVHSYVLPLYISDRQKEFQLCSFLIQYIAV